MFERFDRAARSAVAASADEAGRRGDRRIGTDHLLLGLLHDPEIAALVGVDLARARAGSVILDQQALVAVGVDVGDFTPSVAPRPAKHAPMTSGMRAVLPRALTLATTQKSRRITSRHLLVSLLERDQPDPAATLLTGLGVDRAELRSRAAAAASRSRSRSAMTYSAGPSSGNTSPR